MYKITILPRNMEIYAPGGSNLLEILREHHLSPDAPCGGQGTCGKCNVRIDDQVRRACSVTVDRDMIVELPASGALQILKTVPEGEKITEEIRPVAAFDIGTTSVVCSVVDELTGRVLAGEAAANPQAVYGADVVTRIRSALSGEMDAMTESVRNCMSLLLASACCKAGVLPDRISRVAVVGNPAMQQLFLGISPENLVEIPFSPVLRQAEIVPCGEILPICAEAQLLTVPDIYGYVGADTMGCILAAEIYRREGMTLLVDIGTNGEMVLGNRDRMIACATAAGPALEGANIRFGMRACPGAIDHVWLENGRIRYSTIGGESPRGICGSGLIDAVAAFLELGKINARGRIEPGIELDNQRILPITEEIYLTQEDIRQVQLAKGAIRGGIELMAREMGVALSQIEECMLAGAFGSFLNPESACKIGLLPPALLPKIKAVGNAAAEGANLLAANPEMLRLTDILAKRTEYLELASLGEFPKAFARGMRFEI